jgi:hypothetical protein
MNVWSWVECPACHRRIPTFRLVEHRQTCETKEEREARLRSELAAIERARGHRRERAET